MITLPESLKPIILDAVLGQDQFLGKFSDDIIGFLNLIWPLQEMPSFDDRYDNAEEDAIKHLISNDDWSYEYLFVKRLSILDDDEKFKKFIETIVSPAVRGEKGQIALYVSMINSILSVSTSKFALINFENGLPVYNLQSKSEINDRPSDVPPNEIPFFHTDSKKEKTFPHFYLTYDNWDDYHNKTSYELSYRENNFNSVKIGELKLMKRGAKKTADVLSDHFLTLSDEFCSLGQANEYYANISRLFPEKYRSILLALRDAALFPKIHEAFEEDGIFKESLIRFNEPEQLLREIRFKLNGNDIGEWYKFRFQHQLPYAEEPIALEFDFETGGPVDHRVFAMIGKNGTGKTQILSTLANELSKTDTEKLFPGRPLYGKIFTVSYSIFDHFEIPAGDAAFNYVYCGLKKQGGGFLSEHEIMERILTLADKITYKKLVQEWRKILANFIPNDLLAEIFTGQRTLTLFQPQNFEEFYQKLSSGQNILVLIISEILSQIRLNSLILYDEPETHLHPNAITLLMNTIFELVEKFESYCIIATHSPLVIQEIQARNVIILERDQNMAYVRQMARESFGENLTVITEDIFGNRNIDKHHLTQINQLVNQNLNYDEVLELLTSKNLTPNLNTRLTIKAMISDRDEES
ncbi:ATP-binding protein [Mucilaginibacter conchicola]|uniref:ATP-binding protein n=1 Tax=Mucilaginibacter conchicola TaxID=2303333 RepID=A0A372NMW2_9SPHI|nr:AAA family ATPase [Mucilaginibacter conchicola]RFZ90276.1 ATP-binding protein [Mucilaginibacter conchicola]